MDESQEITTPVEEDELAEHTGEEESFAEENEDEGELNDDENDNDDDANENDNDDVGEDETFGEGQYEEEDGEKPIQDEEDETYGENNHEETNETFVSTLENEEIEDDGEVEDDYMDTNMRDALNKVTEPYEDEEEQLENELSEHHSQVIAAYNAIFNDFMALQKRYNLSQDKLAAHMKLNKKSDFKDKHHSANADEKYMKIIALHLQLRNSLAQKQQQNIDQLQSMLDTLTAQQETAVKVQTQFREYKLGVSQTAENSRTGKSISMDILNQVTDSEIKKDEEVRAIRTKYIALSNKKDALDRKIKQKEFSDGLHLIDFEQYKMENTTLNEKIEEKNESLQKSRLKACSTVHILTHVNEKLQFVQSEDIEMKQRLADLEKELAGNKKVLAKLKDVRDFYKNHNQRMKDSNPLIGNDNLLLDYESRKQELEQLRYHLKGLRNEHAENERKAKGYRKRLETFTQHQGGGTLLPNIHH